MATTAADLPRIELLIRILPGGMMSDWLVNRASVDDVVDVSGPYGQFFLKEKVRAPHVMIAGGTGLAPMMAMIDARSDAEFAESVAPESTAADRACSFVAAMALEAMTAELAAILSKRERVARDERRIERVEAMTHIAKVPS